MSAAPQFNLQVSHQRSCFWVPDYAWLSLLKPQTGRVLSIGPPLFTFVQDSSPQTQAASTSSQVVIQANTLKAGSWIPPGANQAILFENVCAGVQVNDASGKLAIPQIFWNIGDGVTKASYTGQVPITFAAVNNCQMYWTLVNPVPLLVPRPGPSANGPSMQFVLVNSDTSAHTYTRILQFTYRIIFDVDFTSGPSMPGAGVGAAI